MAFFLQIRSVSLLFMDLLYAAVFS